MRISGRDGEASATAGFMKITELARYRPRCVVFNDEVTSSRHLLFVHLFDGEKCEDCLM